MAADVSRPWLETLMTALGTHGRPHAVEVLVVRPNGRRSAIERDARHPLVGYVTAPSDASSGELRAQGIRHATGDFVMLLDGDRPFDLGLLEFLMRSATRADTTEREARA